jgi:butyrate response factor
MVREESIFAPSPMINPHLMRKSSLVDQLNRSKDTKDTSGENYKTELCRTWVEKNFCPYKEKCRFAHGKKDLHEKVTSSKNYKQKECNSFYQKGFCPYGPRCHFKHEERRLDDITRGYYPFLLNCQSNIEKLLNIGSKYSQISPSNHRLKIFEQFRGQTPSPSKLLPFEDIKASREFILPRRILDSYM